MKKRFALLMALVLIAGLLTACGANPDGQNGGSADGDVIKIGVFEPLTGANASGGELELRGIEIAHEMVGEVLGKKVELVTGDNKSDAVEAVTAAEYLVNSQNVDIILGTWGSSFAIAAGPVFKEAQVPAIGTSCTNVNVTLGNEYYFRVCFLDPFQGTIMANYAYNVLGARKAAIIYEVSNDYAVGLKKFFVEAFEGLGGTIVQEAMYNTGDQDFNAQILSVKSANPDVIFAPGNYTESALIMQQAGQMNYDVQFLGGDTWETDPLITVGGQYVEGCIFSTFFDADATINEETTKFVTAYREKYNEDPAAVAALGYDAYMAAIKAFEAAGTTDGPAVQAALAALKFDGCTGTISFDANGDAVKDLAVLKTVKDGKFTYIDTAKLAEDTTEDAAAAVEDAAEGATEDANAAVEGAVDDANAAAENAAAEAAAG